MSKVTDSPEPLAKIPGVGLGELLHIWEGIDELLPQAVEMIKDLLRK